MKELLEIVKIGGNVIDNPASLESFLKEFSKLKGNKILVHGGGKEATRLGKSLGIEAQMINGRRVTDRNTLDIVTMVYAGLINKRAVALLQSDGCDAIGLSGADANVIKAVRRSPKPVDFGFVGDISPKDVNIVIIKEFLGNGLTPVFCAICHDGKGTLLNCNADGVASALASSLSSNYSVRLTYCFDKAGVLADINNEQSVISLITPAIFEELKRKETVSGGMLPKVENALKAVKEGVAEVRICSSENIGDLSGTIIRDDSTDSDKL